MEPAAKFDHRQRAWLGALPVRTYREGTTELTAFVFRADALAAARAGYYPASEVWQGTSLTVTYRPDPTRPSAPPPTPSIRRRLRSRHRGR